MRLIINGRNIDITPALREYVEEKIGRVTRHYDQIMDLEVTLGVIKNPSVQENHFAEVTCFLNGAKIHVHEEAQSMYASIDLLADKLDRQVKKHKDKILRGKTGAGTIRINSVEEIGDSEEPTPEEEIMEIDSETGELE
ncbi:MAG: ribosomal subunit interface protein [Candidatus Melainabacteria bacterium RIFOXYA12_FULL_32_12]|nr:MAG: ribosomal subunit interface protein [Candidatus Melainabacteria bacterium RIFOXYA12_FULL_32_12]